MLGGPLVADVHPAEAGHPTPAAGSDHHDAAEAAAPVAVAPVMAATHATALAAGGSCGRNERGGADGGDGGDGENRPADHGSLLVFCWMCSPHPARQSGERSAGFNGASIKNEGQNPRSEGRAADKFA